MGRTLDVLKRRQPPQGFRLETIFAAAPAAPSFPAAAHADRDAVRGDGPGPKEAAAPPPEPAEEYPYFIEVGGPNRKLEASPAVLVSAQTAPGKHAPAATPAVPGSASAAATTSAPAAATSSRSAPAPLIVPSLTETRPLSVSFSPWPAEPRTGRIMAPEAIAFHQPEHPVSKEYVQLLEKMLLGPTARVVVLSGLAPEAGASTVALNLAVTATRPHQRQVLLVEGQTANLAGRLGLDETAGIEEVLAGTLALEHAVHKTLVPGLHVLTARAADEGPLAPEAVRWLLWWMRERFDLILVDGPSLHSTAALALWAAACDAVYLVAPHSQSLTHSWPRTLGPLASRLKGVIHTRAED